MKNMKNWIAVDTYHLRVFTHGEERESTKAIINLEAVSHFVRHAGIPAVCVSFVGSDEDCLWITESDFEERIIRVLG